MLILTPTNQTEQDPVWDYTIPLGSSAPPEEFVDPEVAETDPIVFRLVVFYNERKDSWYLKILTEADEPILSGFRLTIDYFSGMFWYELSEYFPGSQWLTLLEISGAGVEASYEDLGRSHLLIHSDENSFLTSALALLDQGLVDNPEGLNFDEDRPASIVINP